MIDYDNMSVHELTLCIYDHEVNPMTVLLALRKAVIREASVGTIAKFQYPIKSGTVTSYTVVPYNLPDGDYDLIPKVVT